MRKFDRLFVGDHCARRMRHPVQVRRPWPPLVRAEAAPAAGGAGSSEA